MRSTIQHIFGFTFTMVTIFLAAACSEFTPEDFDSSNITEDVYDKISEYTQNFTYRYGKMDPEHSWGFGELAPEGSKGMMTRAISPSYNFPDDADASKFLVAVPDGVEIYKTYNQLISYIDETFSGNDLQIQGFYDWQSGSITSTNSLYVVGDVDLSSIYFYAGNGAEIYLTEGATLKLPVSGDVTNIQSDVKLYIAEGAKLITEGLLKINSGFVYNHGTIEASSLEVNGSGLLYNTGTVNVTGAILIANSNSVIVNDGTITGASLNTAGSSHIQNNATMTISGLTHIDSNNNTWVNNGHYTTGSFDYEATSSDVINNCHLTVNGEFYIHFGDGKDGVFLMDGGAGVVAETFKGEGPFRIDMGSKSVFKVTGTAVMNATKANYGVYGVGADYAVFHANKIEAGTANQGYEVTYGGKLYVVAETTHFANGFSGAYPYIDFKNGCSEANILQNGSVPAITIPSSECNPGFNGGGTTPDPEPEPDPDPDPMPETVTTETVRVMCEDLGSTHDFDFNDLVFDVCYTYEKDAGGGKTNIQAHITLQAVGGTLPIYIGTDTSDPTKELHYRMTGTYAKNPINVGAGTTCAPVTFTVPATSTDPDDIDICVGNSANKGQKNIILPKSGKGKSFAPQKICVPTTVRWLKESQQIEWGYRIFYNWVRDEDLKPLFWEAEIERSYLY